MKAPLSKWMLFIHHPLSLATIAGSLISKGHIVKILDLNKNDEKDLTALIRSFEPDCIGISFVTPLAEEAVRLTNLIKKIKDDIIVIAGGVYPSTMP